MKDLLEFITYWLDKVLTNPVYLIVLGFFYLTTILWIYKLNWLWANTFREVRKKHNPCVDYPEKTDGQ